ncbi:major facilitator superfamily domain-containing protein [Plectosphaerella cucumerina]|uniref:Major facilitator superfamily domain-containing protein n=1 Tax=Plectosphaerella cucumerina TaxID=40658 RepID=A0A8K0TLI7_9PEZI|nr:major facilitator superfamily domain-containing protein [Plectosphaerella cucumerina]
MDTKADPQIIDGEKLDLKASKGSITAGEIQELDAAEIFLRQHNISNEYLGELMADEAAQKRLVRRIDLILLPLLAGTYLLQYIDKQAMAYAAVFDLFTSTSVTLGQYAWFASIFYFAYLIGEYPWIFLAQKTRLGKVVSACVLSWGAVLMLTALCKDFPGLAACRFFLGIFEAPITTCFMMMVSMWYVRSEQPFRAGIFYCCNGIGSMMGGLLSFAIGQINTFPVWRAVFLICGGLTVVWGVVLLFFLPDDIITAKRFTIEDKAILIGRARLSRTGVLNKSIKWYQIREALIDPQVWLLVLFTLFNEVINGGIASFGRLIIKGIVVDPLKTVALGIPQGAFQVFWILSGTFIASKLRNVRTLVMAAYITPTIIGVALLWKLDRETQKIGLLFGFYICGGFVASLVLALQMPATNLGGYTKRTTASGLVFLAYCVGNIIGPHAFLAKESPTYPTGCMVILICAVAQVVLALTLHLLLTRRNKRRDEAAAAAGIDINEDDETEGADLTDFENPRFRYVL